MQVLEIFAKVVISLVKIRYARSSDNDGVTIHFINTVKDDQNPGVVEGSCSPTICFTANQYFVQRCWLSIRQMENKFC